SPKPEKATSEAEVETSPASEAAPSEQLIPEQIPQPIPEQNSPEPDKLAKFENFRPDFS
ncbi:hypothetical protein A2U01_0072580, partial [Trifolium medium]|nr:hypothetical protein [Trifolium medium]